jgi:DNA-directed RNA polymerase specialized sigma24 family protein
MYARSDLSVKAFKAFQSGKDEGLAQFLAAERPRLFDYIMRMTAHLAKVSDTVGETLDSIEPVADSAESSDELMVMIYKTARNFAIESWNVDTSKLENNAYELNTNVSKDHSIMLGLEQSIRTLPPFQREVLLLVERFWFAPEEVAEIMGISSSDVEMFLAQAQSAVEGQIAEIQGNLHEMMGRLKAFVEPETDSMQTQNLSLIMNDFRKTDKLGIGRSKWFWIVTVILFAGLALAYKNRDQIQSWIQSVTSEPS